MHTEAGKEKDELIQSWDEEEEKREKYKQGGSLYIFCLFDIQQKENTASLHTHQQKRLQN